VRAIFTEHSLNPKVEQAIARETGARVGAPLWADALGPKGSGAATYLDSLRANAEAIVEGLSGGERSCSLPR
jgi:ABC-type Zn uptake system ZnuABC Zn-binding protein ZnuA